MKKVWVSYLSSEIPKSDIDPQTSPTPEIFFCIQLKAKEIYRNVQNFKLYLSELLKARTRGVADLRSYPAVSFIDHLKNEA